MRRIAALLAGLTTMAALASPASARSLATFGMCLAREGAIFYGASWCPQCRAQQKLLGSGSGYVHYVECSADGGREKTQECQDAGITGYPTWVFADGSRVPGRLSIETLAERSGCGLDEEDDDATE
jgi:hypothetical protein